MPTCDNEMIIHQHCVHTHFLSIDHRLEAERSELAQDLHRTRTEKTEADRTFTGQESRLHELKACVNDLEQKLRVKDELHEKKLSGRFVFVFLTLSNSRGSRTIWAAHVMRRLTPSPTSPGGMVMVSSSACVTKDIT